METTKTIKINFIFDGKYFDLEKIHYDYVHKVLKENGLEKIGVKITSGSFEQ